MSLEEQAIVWLADSTIGAAVVLALGAAAIFFSSEPAHRQRIGEWTLFATAVLVLLAGVPGLALYELGLFPTPAMATTLGSSDVADSRIPIGAPIADRVASDTLSESPKSSSSTSQDDRVVITTPIGRSASEVPARSLRSSGDDDAVSAIGSGSLHWQRWVLAAYIGGVVLSLAWLVVGYFGLTRMLRSATPPSDDVQDLWNGLSPVNTGRVRLLVSVDAVLPTTFGIFRPTVLIPFALCRPESRRCLSLALQHELVHIERRDALSWLLANFARVLFFHQPVYWWIRHQLRLSQEYVADSWAAHAGPSLADYAQILTDLAGDLSRHRCAGWHGIGILYSHSDLYRRVAMLSRANGVAQKWCTKRLNMHAGMCAGILVALLALLTLQADGQIKPLDGLQRSESTVAGDVSGALFSRTWHILRQPNTMGLFHGLPQRMEPFSTTTERSGRLWHGVADGGALQLKLQFDSKTKGDVFVGFFVDPRWWIAPPVQVRRFTSGGDHIVDRLPPGTYFIGAIMGSLPRPIALGVERAWPQGVTVEAGRSASAHVLVSDEFSWHDITRNPRDYVGDWPKLHPSRLITVRTVDRNGVPIPYCQVSFSGIFAGTGSSFGTDQDGYTYRDDIAGAFSVTAQRHSFDPLTLAQRYHYKRFAELHDAEERPVIRIAWPPFPSGSGTVTGKVRDQLDRPLTEFHLGIVQRYDGPNNSSDMIGQRIPIIDTDGRFEVRGLAPGEYSITAMAFDYPTHVYQQPDEQRQFSMGQKPNETVHIDIQLEARQLRYGRAVFEDGAPVQRGGWSGPSGSYGLESDGKFRVALSGDERDRLTSLENGNVKVTAHGREGGSGTTILVAWDKLSEDPKQPLTVVLPRPAARVVEQREGPASETNDDPDAKLRLKQLGAIMRTREDGSVKEVVLLDSRFSDSDSILLQKLPSTEKLRFNRTKVGDATLAHVKVLDNLRELEMPGSQITDWGIEQLHRMPSLRSFDVSHTNVTDVALYALATLDQLERLDLTGTKVTDAGMHQLARLTKLKQLILTDTAVTDVGLASISGLTQLEDLRLWGLPVSDEGLRVIAGLKALKRLDLRGTDVTDRGLEHLSGIRGLTSLRLAGTAITDLGVDTIVKFSLLEELHLSRTQVTDACLGELTKLKKLRVLYIEPNITDAALSHLADIPRLEVLGIGGPNVTDAGMQQIARLTGLTNLFLDDSNITDASIPHLSRLRKLLLLSLQRTQITPRAMEKFYQSYSRPPQVFGPQ